MTEQETAERIAAARIDHDLLDCLQTIHEALGEWVGILISQGCKEFPVDVKALMAMLELRQKQIIGLKYDGGRGAVVGPQTPGQGGET